MILRNYGQTEFEYFENSPPTAVLTARIFCVQAEDPRDLTKPLYLNTEAKQFPRCGRSGSRIRMKMCASFSRDTRDQNGDMMRNIAELIWPGQREELILVIH